MKTSKSEKEGMALLSFRIQCSGLAQPDLEPKTSVLVTNLRTSDPLPYLLETKATVSG